MKKFLFLSIAAVLLICPRVFAESFDFLSISNSTKNIHVTEKSSGKALWDNNIKFQNMTYDSKPFFYIEENGSGIYGKDGKFKSWISKAYYFISDGKAAPYQTSKIFKNKSGQVIQTINKYYYPDKNLILCKIDNSNKEFNLKKDLVDIELLGTALMFYPFSAPRDFQFNLLTNEPQMYKITMKYIGKENVDTDSGRVLCHKLEMSIDLGALNIFGAFVPKTYFWYTVSEPNTFVRYEGLESGLGTPYIVMEITGK